MPDRRVGRALVLSGALFALLWIGGCCCDPPVTTVCGDCDEEGVIVSGLGGSSAPPPTGFANPDDLIEYLSTGYNSPPPTDLDGEEVILVKALLDGGGGVELDARGILDQTFRSRPVRRDGPPAFWLVVMTSAETPVYWRSAADPRTVRSEKPGITTSRSASGEPVQMQTGLATYRLPFVPSGIIRLYEAVPPGSSSKPPLAEFTFDLDLPLVFATLGGIP